MFEFISSDGDLCEFAVSRDDRIVILNMFEDNMIDKENIRFPTFESPEYIYVKVYNIYKFPFKYNRANRFKSYIERKMSDIPKGYHLLLSRITYQKIPKIEAFWSYPWVPNYIRVEPRQLRYNTLGKFIKTPLFNGKTTIDIINQSYSDDSESEPEESEGDCEYLPDEPLFTSYIPPMDPIGSLSKEHVNQLELDYHYKYDPFSEDVYTSLDSDFELNSNISEKDINNKIYSDLEEL